MPSRCAALIASLLTLYASLARAAAPASAPSIQQVRLDDPLNADAKTFLDLDSGKTFPFSEYHREIFIRESGVDIMCETREPTHGFTAHDLALADTKATIDQPPPPRDLFQILATYEPTHFDLREIKDTPKTFLFKTKHGAHGVLEISAIEPTGMQLRYLIIPRPKVPTVAAPIRMPIAVRIQQMQMGVFLQTKRYGPTSVQVRSMRKQLELMKNLAVIEDSQKALEFMGFQPKRLASIYERAMNGPRTVLTPQEMKQQAELRRQQLLEMQQISNSRDLSSAEKSVRMKEVTVKYNRAVIRALTTQPSR